MRECALGILSPVASIPGSDPQLRCCWVNTLFADCDGVGVCPPEENQGPLRKGSSRSSLTHIKNKRTAEQGSSTNLEFTVSRIKPGLYFVARRCCSLKIAHSIMYLQLSVHKTCEQSSMTQTKAACWEYRKEHTGGALKSTLVPIVHHCGFDLHKV